MKPLEPTLLARPALAALLLAGLLIYPAASATAASAPTPVAQEQPVPDDDAPPPPETEEPLPPEDDIPVPVPDDIPEPFLDSPDFVEPPGNNQLPAPRPSSAPTRSTPTIMRTTPAEMSDDGERNLHLNFRGAPLELVLDYLSEAAGFIIDLQTDVKGQVDVWSNQPLNRAEAVDVLNSVLNRNGYAAIRHGRTLTIVSRDDARRMNIPVISGGNPDEIPATDVVVTQIIPVRFINATQLTQDLQPLLPSQATMTANEGGNAIVITDTQANIRRMAEIVRALDTAISATSAVRVFPLKYADAKALATVVTELFQNQDASQRTGNPMQQFFRGPGQRGGNQQPATPSGRVATPRVIATADERSNSLVVSAPEDHMPVIEDLVRDVDTNVEDITEVRVFRLQNADAQETADLLTSLFPDTTTTQNVRGQVQFGRGGPQAALAAAAAATPSARVQMQTRVTAVPDHRTGSVVVSAARNIMEQIAQMIEVLDADPARRQKVFVFDVENTDPLVVQEVLQNLFPSQNYGTATGARTTQQVGSQLNTRASQTQNQGLMNPTGFGTGTGTGTGARTATGR